MTPHQKLALMVAGKPFGKDGVRDAATPVVDKPIDLRVHVVGNLTVDQDTKASSRPNLDPWVLIAALLAVTDHDLPNLVKRAFSCDRETKAIKDQAIAVYNEITPAKPASKRGAVKGKFEVVKLGASG